MARKPEAPEPVAALLFPWDDEEEEEKFTIPDQDAGYTGDADGDHNMIGPPHNSAGTFSESLQAVAVCFGISFTTKQFYETKLSKLLNNANAAHHLYKDIMQWARDAHNTKYNFDPQHLSRNAQVQYLEKWLQMEKCRPQQIPTLLPGPAPQVVQTTCFNFTKQLHSLVSDQALFGQLANLDVNANDPFGKYEATNGLLSTTNSGQMYYQAYQHLVKNPDKDFLMPIIMTCDETQTGTGKISSWPLLCTTSILNQKMRNLSIAWRTLGYINDLSLIQSAAEDSMHTKEVKAERLHSIFKTILASLIEAQQPGALDNIPLTFGNVSKIVNLKVPVFFIIGDMQGGDKICATSCHYSNKMNCLCRKCNVRGSESGNPLVECKRISMVKMMQFVKENRQDILDQYNQYNIQNAWFPVCYGGCKFGIFSAACPIEPLHSLENGMITQSLLILFKDKMKGPKNKAELDALVRGLVVLPRQRFARAGTQPDMPRLL